MKKKLLVVLLTTVALFSCQKESDVLPKGNNANYFVENGVLNVKNQSVLDSLVAANLEKSEEEVVAWSDSLGFKSLASVYKDAEKEKDALTVEELKAKYDGKLVFNTEKGAEKEFTCAIENLNLAGFVNENAQISINGEVKCLRGNLIPRFKPYENKLKIGMRGTDYLQSIDGKRCIQVWVSNSKFIYILQNGGWDLVVDVYTEKKVWGGWIGYNGDVYIRDKSTGIIQNWDWVYTDSSLFHPGHYRYFAYSVPRNNSFRVWSSGVPEYKGITVLVNYNCDLSVSY